MSTMLRGGFADVSRRTAAWIASFTITMAACAAMAQETPVSPPSDHEPRGAQLVEIERLFWLCDYVATTRGVHAAPVETCSAVTEALKNMKFGGDFMALLAWWHGNKPGEHARLAHVAAESAALERRDNRPAAYAPLL
jgi:hypothetical protein